MMKTSIETLRNQIYNLLWMQMEYLIIRLILSTERCDGGERAQRHLELSGIYVAYRLMISQEAAKRHWDQVMKIHDATSDLTGHLDKLGMSRHREYDLDKVARKFFDKFLKIADQEWEKIADTIDN